MVKELDLKLTLGLTERQSTALSLHLADEESWGGGQQFESWSDPKSPSLRVWLFLGQSVTVPARNSLEVKQRPKTMEIPRKLEIWNIMSMNKPTYEQKTDTIFTHPNDLALLHMAYAP